MSGLGRHLALGCVLAALLAQFSCEAEPGLEQLAGKWKVQDGVALLDFRADGTGRVFKDGDLPGKLHGPCDPEPCLEGTCVKGADGGGVCRIACSSNSQCPAAHSCSAEVRGQLYCFGRQDALPAQPFEARVDSFNAFRMVLSEASYSPGTSICFGCRLESNDVIRCDDILEPVTLVSACSFVRLSKGDAGVHDASDTGVKDASDTGVKDASDAANPKKD